MSEAPDGRPLVEVGWLLVGDLEPADLEAADRAREALLARLGEAFPEFRWRMPGLRRREPRTGRREEPIVLLEVGASERERRRWDLALVVTGADLASHYLRSSIGATSSAVDAAVVSTYLLDPQDDLGGSERRVDLLALRLEHAALHVVGHLLGLDHREDPGNAMRPMRGGEDADRDAALDEDQLETLRAELHDVADLRLEERIDVSRSSRLAFDLRAAWHAREEVLRTVRQGRAWQLPFRLSRLTTAAVSTTLVLMTTAEAWDLGASRTPRFVVLFSLLALAGTSAYVLARQRLLVLPGRRRTSEQTAVARASVVAIVATGMLSTYALLAAASLLVGLLVYGEDLVASWAPSVGGEVGLRHYLTMSAFVAALGITIGALGASFEGQERIRHVAYVDDED